MKQKMDWLVTADPAYMPDAQESKQLKNNLRNFKFQNNKNILTDEYTEIEKGLLVAKRNNLPF